MRRWDRLVETYIEGYAARGINPASVASARRRLERWGQWLKQRRPRVAIERIDASLITRYVESCSSFRAKATVYSTLSQMRGFGDFLVGQGLWATNPLRWMKGPRITPYSRLPKRIDRAQMEAMWKQAAQMHGSFPPQLWVTVLALLYGTGLRRGELERLELDAFDREQGLLRIDGRKTGVERCVPLPEMVLRCLEVYLPARQNQLDKAGVLGQKALLVARSGARLTGQAISNGIHALSRRAGIPLHTLHQFRHTCASDLLEAGVHLADVQRILGHAGIATTVRYVHIADPQRREAMTMHPLNQWLAPLQAAA
jgi:integrase/recombinase XerD